MKVSMIICIFFFNLANLAAQAFVNGSFEKSRISCEINMTNKDFNAAMANCYAFGKGDQVDILDKNCSWGLPQHGAKFIAMADDESENDELSIELMIPLQKDSSYTISFYMRKEETHRTCKVQVGYSTTYSGFGTLITTIEPVENEKWEEKKISFVPNSNAKFITLRVVSGGDGWQQFDNFTFVGKNIKTIDPSGADPH